MSTQTQYEPGFDSIRLSAFFATIAQPFGLYIEPSFATTIPCASRIDAPVMPVVSTSNVQQS